MGGTFDPVHNGHLVAASEAADLFGLDEVVFVPTGQPWQKDRHVTAAEDRYLMTVIATASNPRFSVSRVDIDRGGPTYTTDTLRDLRALHPDADLYFITVADALGSILTWQGAGELFGLARFVAVSRPGYELTDVHITEAFQRLPEDALWHDLKARDGEWAAAGIKSVRRIGDADAPAPIAWATYAGHRFARELDGEPLNGALSFRREVTEITAVE